MDPHKNLFYYYGTQSSDPQKDEYQIENNTTKSLINLLEKCDEPEITRKFIKKFTSVVPSGSNIKYELQNRDLAKDLRSKKQRAVLLIYSKEKRENGKIKLNDSIPDAWIYSNNDNFAILVEVKTSSNVNKDQLRRHCKLLNVKKENKHQWPEVYSFLKEMQQKFEKKLLVNFLLTEFLEYLEVNNMATLNFNSKDFGFFEDQEMARNVKSKVEGILKKAKPKKGSMWVKPLAYQSKLNMENQWVGAVLTKYERQQDFAHISTGLTPSCLEVFVVLNNKAKIRRLVKDCLESDQLRKSGVSLSRVFNQLKGGSTHSKSYKIIIQFIERDKNRKNAPTSYSEVLSLNLDFSEQNDYLIIFKKLKKLLKRKHHGLEIKICKEMPRATLIKMSEDETISFVRKTISELYAVYELIRDLTE
ncbi:MAG: hypothetical protein ABII22_00795 [Candidatus Micrarchaeota archaeon]